MVDLSAPVQRFRRYLRDGELVSAGAVVAASMGEPTLAHQLELMRVRANDTAVAASQR